MKIGIQIMRQQKTVHIQKLLVLLGLGVCSALGLGQNVAIAQLNQANKAKQSEAKQFLGAMTRSQQAYYLENGKFTSDIEELGRIVPSGSTNYSYSMRLVGDGQVQLFATSKRPALKSYTSAVFLIEIEKDTLTNAIMCEATRPGAIRGPVPQLVKGKTKCSAGSVELRLI